MMASGRLAIGRPDTGSSGGADIARVSGHSVLMFGLSMMPNLSSKTKTPRKLVEYAHPAAMARRIASRRFRARLNPGRGRRSSREGRCGRVARGFSRLDATEEVSVVVTRRQAPIVGPPGLARTADRSPDSRCA
jgi:hypothetical protein